MNNNSTEIMDKTDLHQLLFNSFMDKSAFYYPAVNNDLEEVMFCYSSSFFYMNPKWELSYIYIFLFDWMNELRKENPGFHNQIIFNLLDMSTYYPDEVKRAGLIQFFLSDELPTLFSDSSLLDYVYHRVMIYLAFFEQMGTVIQESLVLFDGEIDDYMRRDTGRKFPLITTYLNLVNSRFPKTSKIRDFSEMDFRDIQNILLRDYLTVKGRT